MLLWIINQLNTIKLNTIKYKRKDGKYRGKFELQQANLMTKPRFDVILGILKTQDARIRELEGIIKNLNKPKKLGLGPHADADWNYA